MLPTSKAQICMSLEDMRDHINSKVSRELPYSVPFSAKTSLIHRAFEDWKAISKPCFGTVADAAQKTIVELVEKMFPVGTLREVVRYVTY